MHTSDTCPKMPGFKATDDSKKEPLFQKALPSVPIEIGGIPCLDVGCFLKQIHLLCLSFLLKKHLLRAQAMVCYISCAPQAIEQQQRIQCLNYSFSSSGRIKFFCNILGKVQCIRACYADGPLL